MGPFPLQLAGLLPVVVLLSTLLHELAHVVAVVAVGGRVSALELGSGRPLPPLRVKGFRLQLRANIFGGARIHWNPNDFGYRRQLVVNSAGLVLHLILILALLPFVRGSWEVATVVAVNALMLLTNLVPVSLSGKPNDGRNLVTVLRVRPAAGQDDAALWASLFARAGEGDVKPLLHVLEQAQDGLAPGSPERAAMWAGRAFALSLLGRFDQAALLDVAGDPVTIADHQVCAALFGQLMLTDIEIERLAEMFVAALSDLAPDQVAHRAAVEHSLAVIRLLQGQPDSALVLLDGSPAGVTGTANRAAVQATRGVALAQQGDLEGAQQLISDLRLFAPWSPWLSVLSAAVEVAV